MKCIFLFNLEKKKHVKLQSYSINMIYNNLTYDFFQSNTRLSFKPHLNV